MFPYPSGKIHMGHVRNYTLGDVVARYKRARGFAVLHPMGWDAFGLPAENAARERGIHPAKWTRENIATMRAELQRMGLSLEWEREFATCDPDYYGHQQKLFLDFLRAGLVERKESWVNWDPVDGTVLANEQVIDGRGWRSGALVEKKQLSQWFLKITDYAQDLLAALDTLDRWPERVRLMQAKWIGRSEGARLTFPLRSARGGIEGVEVYTTRPDTLFGMSFLALAPEHPLSAVVAARDPKAAEFVAECRRMGTSEAVIETAEKQGYDTGLRVRHPFLQDATFPVWIANFVLMEYGTGAIFGCPAHDQRDLEFAAEVRAGRGAGGAAAGRGSGDVRGRRRGLCRAGRDLQFGLPGRPRRRGGEARGDRRAGAAWRGRRRGELAAARLGCEPAALLGLPDPGDPLRRLWRGAGAGRSVAGETTRRRDVRPAGQSARSPSRPGSTSPARAAVPPARRETDTFDTFVDSSWYFARFCSPRADVPVERTAVDHWMPVDQYIGGIEHAILHLLYSRFFTARDEAHRAPGCRGAVRRPVHPGHGDARELSLGAGPERHLAVSGRGGSGSRTAARCIATPASRWWSAASRR